MNAAPTNLTEPVAPASTASAATRVLLIEDSPADVLLISALLGDEFNVTQVPGLREGIAAAAQASFDIVLLDLFLGDSRGLDTFAQLQALHPELPILVMSGLDDEQVAESAVHDGAQDYLVKGQMDEVLLHRAVRYAIERKRVERALRDSEAFYQSLVENLPQFIYRKDAHSRFTFANRRFCTLLGKTLQEIIGRTDYDFFPAELAAKYQADDQRVMAAGKLFETVEEHTPPGGEKEHVQVVKSPVFDAHGKIIGTQGIFWDVTARVRGEEKLKKAHADLARSREDLLRTLADLQRSHNQLKEAQLQIIEMEKMQSIGQMAAGIAHEVKNPLAIIRMGIDFLNETAVAGEEPGATVLKDMNDALHRADGIIMGLLDFSTPGKADLKPGDLNTLLRSSLNLVKHELRNARIKVETEFCDNLPPALVDANKIKQVFVNALTNAAHAMPEGGTLTVRSYIKKLTPEEARPSPGARQAHEFRAGERVLVTEIDDDGSGVPEDKLGRVFEPFYTTKPAGKGTGLGLTVSRKIVELHEGGIQIQNRTPRGARVTITLRTERT
ncbi:MAG: Multi-sensor signal transduction histidine kinase [Limisphaerales bacterium]|nr:MAG: Multi-sensor signal transduction histidine kinase [Limisphaerales bacterium]KAG0507285.1 MAG: Multi-sensor signal transduction histidine kinase [Limisphaerales bacterium]TXT46740.1 MAG: Multi-sensor signal transduction histidine kinase [Limisphaerales bacterium]